MNRRQALEAITALCVIPAAAIRETGQTCWLSLRYHLGMGRTVVGQNGEATATMTFSFRSKDIEDSDPGFLQELPCSIEDAREHLMPKMVHDGWAFRLSREKPDPKRRDSNEIHHLELAV